VNCFPENKMGEIGTAIHRIVIKSILEIVQSIKQDRHNIRKQDAKQFFIRMLNKKLMPIGKLKNIFQF
jgi:hypothetical protein